MNSHSCLQYYLSSKTRQCTRQGIPLLEYILTNGPYSNPRRDPKLVLDHSSNPRVILNRQDSIMTTATRATNIVRFKYWEAMSRQLTMGLYVLLVLLSWVNGIRDIVVRDIVVRDSVVRDSVVRDSVVRDNEVIDNEARDSEISTYMRYRIPRQGVLPTPIEMHLMLTDIGFALTESPCNLKVRYYIPKQAETQTPESDSNPNSAPVQQNKPLKYVVETSSDNVHYNWPMDVDATTISNILNQVQTIAIFKAQAAYIGYYATNPSYSALKMQLLSYLITLFDCRTLNVIIEYSSDFTKPTNYTSPTIPNTNPDKINIAPPRLPHSDYSTPCQLLFSSITNSSLQALIESRVVLARTFSSVRFIGHTYNDTHLLNRLPLTNNYTLIVDTLSLQTNLNLTALQTPQFTCAQIIVQTPQGMKVTIEGLANAINKHPKLILQISWEELKHLASRTRSRIDVHTLLGLDITPSVMTTITEAETITCPDQDLVTANLIIFNIATNMPCYNRQYFIQECTQKRLANLGIAVKEIQFHYSPNRTDIRDTIKFFCKYQHNITSTQNPNDPNDPNDPNKTTEYHLGDPNQSTECHPDDPNREKYKIQTPITIRLDSIHLSLNDLINHRQKHGQFCPNIKYTTIHIKGSDEPKKGMITKCIELLKLFCNLHTDQLILTNIRNRPAKSPYFNSITTATQNSTTAKETLTITNLTLDNVDEYLICWLFSHYRFSQATQVQILNPTNPTNPTNPSLLLPNQFTINGSQGTNKITASPNHTLFYFYYNRT
ncbi:hypothetical protein NEHOM01_0226 [Nematocida homosporus]|uniref:uncharacterized protein n=1 Tax=Nematocida homosporus TaxID=1912981 RepID=UPI0022205237|nr:uncharacterized protein NEHOM01_0226 [Nematocida homosporus]KAI5184551.1 hypothetical protein NEHOM01_0226 [Nematocida homosporus]